MGQVWLLALYGMARKTEDELEGKRGRCDASQVDALVGCITRVGAMAQSYPSSPRTTSYFMLLDLVGAQLRLLNPSMMIESQMRGTYTMCPLLYANSSEERGMLKPR